MHRSLFSFSFPSFLNQREIVLISGTLNNEFDFAGVVYLAFSFVLHCMSINIQNDKCCLSKPRHLGRSRGPRIIEGQVNGRILNQAVIRADSCGFVRDLIDKMC